jgi:hypothetical protein
MSDQSSFGESFSKVWQGTKASVIEKTGLGRLSEGFDRLRGKKKDKPNPPPNYYGARFVGDTDFRTFLRVPEKYYTGQSTGGIFSGLIPFSGILFPYTPSISQDYTANYSTANPTHSNYSLYFYKHSTPGPITVTGKFTVQNIADAYYWLAVTHLLRALTKMHFGKDVNAGAPPQICEFSSYGNMQYKNVPVVLQSFKVELPDSVDYFVTPETLEGLGSNAVPVSSSITIVLLPMYSRRELLGQAQVDDYLGAAGVSGGNIRAKGFL